MDRRLWWLIATVFATVLILAVAGVLYVNHTVVQEGRKQCVVYTLLDRAYSQTPPTTAAGRSFAAAIHKVVADLGCS